MPSYFLQWKFLNFMKIEQQSNSDDEDDDDDEEETESEPG